MSPLNNFAPIPRNVPSFLPTYLSGLQLWLDSTDPTTINSGSPANGDSVTAWRDKSGNSNDYTGAGSLPVYVTAGVGGKPTMNYPTGLEWFDGGTTNYFSVASGYSLFFVVNLNNITPALRIIAQFAYLDANDTPTFFFGAANALIGTPDMTLTTQGNASWGRPGYATPASTVGLSAAYAFFYNGGGVTITNYSAQAQFTDEAPIDNPLGGAVIYKNFIGNFNNGTNFGYEGFFSEVLVYNRQLNSTEIGQVNGYLQTKYSL